MKLNRDVLISTIIRHQNTFFRLLDHIDKNDGASEIPEHLYLHLYNNVICADSDESEQHQLMVDSLIENGVFIHNDRNTGMITLERVVVDLLRFLDVKRARELTNSDFEQMRSQIESSVEQVLVCELDSQDYQEAMATFNRSMSETLSKIKENVHGLISQVESIAYEYKLYDSGSTDIKLSSLYTKISNVYNRYVLPCYEFISPSMEMRQKQTFSQAVQRLFNFHSSQDHQRFENANLIQFRKTAISSYYKDISALARKLEQFSRHLEKDRTYLLAIESAYSELIQSLVPLRHGKRKNMYLNRTSPVFQNHSVLDGLTHQKMRFSAKLHWDGEKSKLRFKEYLATLQNTHVSPKDKTLLPIPPMKKLSEQRQIMISKLLYQQALPDEITDVHCFIYDLLNEQIVDFQLLDVLYGLEAFIAITGGQKSSRFTKKQISDDRYYLNYIQYEYTKEIADGL